MSCPYCGGTERNFKTSECDGCGWAPRTLKLEKERPIVDGKEMPVVWYVTDSLTGERKVWK
jgi:hypothetical protein